MFEYSQLIPIIILERYKMGNQAGHLEANCRFVDLSGFSTVTNALVQYGDEAVKAMSTILDRSWEPFVRTVYIYGGLISGFAGDAFTALFEDDRSSEVASSLIRHTLLDTLL